MSSTSMVNWAPVLNIVLMGLIVAMGPLIWVWLKTRSSPSPAPSADGVGQSSDQLLNAQAQLKSNQRLLLLAQITLFLTFDLLIFGAFTRLTDSGLGCPDWPGCYGYTSPGGANEMIQNAQSLMPTGPVTQVKAWIEMIHRYLATGVGVLILTIALYTVVQSNPKKLKFASLFILFWVCLQGAFGALTVTMRLFPAVVTMHLMGAVVLLILLTRFVMGQRSWVQLLLDQFLEHDALLAGNLKLQGEQSLHLEHIQKAANALKKATKLDLDSGALNLRWMLRAGLILTLVQIALGGWVSTNYAVTACTTFPMCQNSWWPLMNFAQGFELWRPLGVTSGGAYLDFQALTAIHYLHRLFAYVVFTYVCVLGYFLFKRDSLKTLGKLIWFLIALQILTGVSNVIFQWPLLAAVMHTGGAAALAVALTIGLKMVQPRHERDMHLRDAQNESKMRHNEESKGVL